MGKIDSMKGRESIGPQGLKPASFVVLGGTAEAVPFHKTPRPAPSQNRGLYALQPRCTSVRVRFARTLSPHVQTLRAQRPLPLRKIDIAVLHIGAR